MPVFRTEKVSDYAVIAKHHLKNRALSYKAKGLMTFMLSVPDDWDYSMAGLAVLASDGIDGVRSGIRELEKHGYLTRRRICDVSGKLGDIEYTVHEVPQIPNGDEPDSPPSEPPSNPPTPTSEKPILEKPTLGLPTLEKPILDFPTLAKPTLEKPTLVLPTLENPMQLSNKVLSNKELSIKEPNNKQTNPVGLSVPDTDSADSSATGQLSLENTANPHQQAECLTVEMARGAGKPEYHTMTLVEQQFELFWQLYPRKAGKKAAKKIWMDIKPDESMFLTIMTAITTANQYWQHQGISLKHIPHPSTWLDEERWEDEFSAEQLSGYEAMPLDAGGKGGAFNATIGANYTIGGDDDPYRAIMPD